MKRRTFIRLIGGGVVFSAIAGPTACSSEMPPEAIAAWQGPKPGVDVRKWILSYAILAPHSHNLQSWLVDLRTPNEIMLYCDLARLLPETDPMRRPMVEVLAQRRFAALNFNDDDDRSEAEMLQQEFKKFKELVREEGREQGREQGLVKGRAEGVLAGGTGVLLRLLEKKFGALPQEAVAKLQAATQEQVDKWTERILTADSLEAVFAD